MKNSSQDVSQQDENRTAVSVAAGSLVVIVAVGVVYWLGLFDELLPAGGPTADAVPLLLIVSLFVLVLVVWSWSRVLSFFE